MKNKKLLGAGLLLLTSMIWGTAFVAQRVGMESIEPLTFNAARMALAAAAVGLPALYRGRRDRRAFPDRSEEERRLFRRNTVVGGLCCGFFLAGGSILQQMGLVYTTAGKAGFITALYMLLVPIAAFLLFKRKSSWLVWLAVAMGVAGLYCLCITEGFSLTQGDTLVCLCAVFFCGHILCIDHFVQKGDPVGISAVQFAAVTVISCAAALLTEAPSMDKLVSAAVPILYCGLISGGLGYTLQILGQKYTDPTVASLLMSMESVFAVLAGSLLLRERMSPRELTGCVIMFAAIVLVQIPLPGSRSEI